MQISMDKYAITITVDNIEIRFSRYFAVGYNFGDEQQMIFHQSSIKTQVLGTHKNRLVEPLQMSTHNTCFYGEIRKIIFKLSQKYHPFTLPGRFPSI